MDPLFTKRDLQRLIIPLIIEQFLVITVGMADIIMISSVGENAVSGVSLVNTVNILLINIFAALATGGAVVCAQYYGKKDLSTACETAKQLLVVSTVIASLILILVLLFRAPILALIFGNVDPDIMDKALVYFLLSGLSYPFLAIYNSSAALFRAMGNSRVSMMTSLLMNIMNIGGNAIFIFGLHFGVAGVGLATLISRIVAAVVMLFLITMQQHPIHINIKTPYRYNWTLVKQIFAIGIPNSLENSMFQVGKILVLSLVTTFGTTAIAANAVSNTVASFSILPGIATGLALITIVGQCYGAGAYDQIMMYTKKILKLTYLFLFLLNIIIYTCAPIIVEIYHLTPDTAALTLKIVRYHSTLCILIWPLSFTLPNVLRAANDAKYTMIIAILSMWTFRIGFSYILGSTLGLGVFGIWIAMTIDWGFRSICLSYRFLRKRWLPKASVH